MAFKNTKRGHLSVMRICLGKIQVRIVYPDGSLVKGPKALCELQGYVYDAWVRTAEVFDALGKSDRARKLRAKAATLFERFNSAFWGDELGFYALALDGDKNKVLTVASNAGHCLLSGIVPPERAKKVKGRLMASDMWTGWGIRTVSASNPAFNTYNYQTGSVWPHDNAIIALGFKRYGFDAEAAQIAHDISKAASYFQLNQPPELYTAFQRDETTFPVQYIWCKRATGVGGRVRVHAHTGYVGIHARCAA
jgi:glycogen debranching enzyme